MTIIQPPKERACERCGRRDVWDDDAENWVIVEVDGDRRVGTPGCIHEWDINGSYSPIADDGDGPADADG